MMRGGGFWRRRTVRRDDHGVDIGGRWKCGGSACGKCPCANAPAAVGIVW